MLTVAYGVDYIRKIYTNVNIVDLKNNRLYKLTKSEHLTKLYSTYKANNLKTEVFKYKNPCLLSFRTYKIEPIINIIIHIVGSESDKIIEISGLDGFGGISTTFNDYKIYPTEFIKEDVIERMLRIKIYPKDKHRNLIE